MERNQSNSAVWCVLANLKNIPPIKIIFALWNLLNIYSNFGYLPREQEINQYLKKIIIWLLKPGPEIWILNVLIGNFKTWQLNYKAFKHCKINLIKTQH